MKLRTILFCLFTCTCCLCATAQSYSIDWYKIAGGGGTSNGGVYSVSGTTGQQDAGEPLTGGNFSLTGGFWALYAVQTPGAPVLSIKLTATNTAMVYWTSPSTGYNLQVNTNLATTNWVTLLETVTDDGTNKFIIVNPPTGNRFYRLNNEFSAVYAVQTPGAPKLSVRLTTTNTWQVYWASPATSFILQVNTDLSISNWVTPAEPVQDNGLIKYIIVNPPTGSRFYRLTIP